MQAERLRAEWRFRVCFSSSVVGDANGRCFFIEQKVKPGVANLYFVPMTELDPHRLPAIHKSAVLTFPVDKNESGVVALDTAMMGRHDGLLNADRVGRVAANTKAAGRQGNLRRRRAG